MDWLAILDKWGWPAVIIFGTSIFFYTKAWPLIERFVLGVIDQMKSMTAALEIITDTLKEITKKQDDAVARNVELAGHLLEEIRKRR